MRDIASATAQGRSPTTASGLQPLQTRKIAAALPLSESKKFKPLPKPASAPQATATLSQADPPSPSGDAASHARELSDTQFWLTLCALEAQRCWSVRLQRALSAAQRPNAKTLANFDWTHVPTLNPAPLMPLAAAPGWLERTEHLLLCGAAGIGRL